jgi:hypothetical protein
VEISAPKAAMVLAALALVGGGAAYGWSDLQMRDRLTTVRSSIRQIGYSRGGQLPSDPEVRAQVEALAAERGVTLEGLAVSSHEEAGLGPVAALAGGPLTTTLSGRQRIYDVRATGTASELVFSRSEPIEVAISLRVSVQLAPRSGRGGGGLLPGQLPGGQLPERAMPDFGPGGSAGSRGL